MRTFLISYDLAKTDINKHALATSIMSLGSSWARPLEQTWYVRAETSESEIEARLGPLLGDDDGLIVQSVAEAGMLTNTQLRWFRQRRQSLESETAANCNIVAFPPIAALPQQPAELSLAS